MLQKTDYKIGDRVSYRGKVNALLGLNGTVVGDLGSYQYFRWLVDFDDPENQQWPIASGEITPLLVEAAPPQVTINQIVALYPQTRTILNHLEKRGSISPMEALMGYGCMRLAARIHELRNAGFNIQTMMKRDEAGHAYARYFLFTNQKKAA